MKFLLKLLLVILLAAAVFHIWTNWPVRLDVSQTTVTIQPAPPSQTNVTLTLLTSGYIESLHAMNVRGGNWEPYNSGVMAVLLEHPKGRFLIDAGLGKNAKQHFLTTPPLMQKVATLHNSSSTTAELEKRGLALTDIDGILLTHAHWDHTSGLEDLLELPVWAASQEIEFIDSGNEHVALVSQWREQLQLKAIPFDNGPYRGFAQSHDLFADGSVVIVPISGHTPGSIGIFVTNVDGGSLLFIGDSSWTKEGVDWPAEKPFIAKHMVEHDAEAVKNSLIQLHQLQASDPRLTIIPAHDERVYSAIR